MNDQYTIQLSKVIGELSLEALYLPKSADDILIVSREVNRPGIELNGFYDYFDNHRITIIGRAEMAMLENFGEEKKLEAIKKFFSMSLVKHVTV